MTNLKYHLTVLFQIVLLFYLVLCLIVIHLLLISTRCFCVFKVYFVFVQILDLLHFKDKLTARQFQLVATRAVLCMVQEKTSFAQQYLLAPLLAPLHHCTTLSSQ